MKAKSQCQFGSCKNSTEKFQKEKENEIHIWCRRSEIKQLGVSKRNSLLFCTICCFTKVIANGTHHYVYTGKKPLEPKISVGQFMSQEIIVPFPASIRLQYVNKYCYRHFRFKSRYVPAIQVQTLNGLHIDRLLV